MKLTSTRLNEKHLLRAGTSGFRGRNNERLVRNIAAYAVAFGEYLKPDKRVIIGYDERPCSQSNALLCSVILKYSGLDCEIVKESVTISSLVKKVLDSNKERGREVTYGVMCGASHNPLTDNGMNFIMGDGSIAEEDITNRLAEIVLKEELLLSSGMTEKPERLV